jgi:hypothetical protein
MRPQPVAHSPLRRKSTGHVYTQIQTFLCWWEKKRASAVPSSDGPLHDSLSPTSPVFPFLSSCLFSWPSICCILGTLAFFCKPIYLYENHTPLNAWGISRIIVYAVINSCHSIRSQDQNFYCIDSPHIAGPIIFFFLLLSFFSLWRYTPSISCIVGASWEASSEVSMTGCSGCSGQSCASPPSKVRRVSDCYIKGNSCERQT